MIIKSSYGVGLHHNKTQSLFHKNGKTIFYETIFLFTLLLDLCQFQTTNKVGADTESSTSTGGASHSRDKDIQDSEGSSSGEGNHNDLLKVDLLLGDGESSKSHNQTLDRI